MSITSRKSQEEFSFFTLILGLDLCAKQLCPGLEVKVEDSGLRVSWFDSLKASNFCQHCIEEVG